MADEEHAKDAILEAIERLAKATGPYDTSAGTSPGLSTNVVDLAEAWAWLTSTNQPHGGRTSVTVTGK